MPTVAAEPAEKPQDEDTSSSTHPNVPINLSIVEVPSVQCPFPEAVLQQLKQEVDPLDNSMDLEGIELYQKTLAFLDQV